VKEVVEKHDNLLIYPAGYEGIEESKNIIYLGIAPNQQLIPAVSWMLEQKGKKVYLIGSDYLMPHISNEILAHEIKAKGGETVGVGYITLGSMNVEPIIDDLIAKKPDIVFSTIVGETNRAFIERLYDKTPSAQRPSVLSFDAFQANQAKKFYGLNWVGSYQRGLINPENKAFLKAYEKKYGSSMEAEETMITAYTSVYLWAQAVLEAPTINPETIREYMLRQSIASPAGVLYIDPVTAHAWRSIFIAHINQQGLWEMIWTSNVPIEPIVFPDFKTKSEWSVFEYKLFMDWGKSWEKTK
jgi:urea transport system substrate-binding protein